MKRRVLIEPLNDDYQAVNYYSFRFVDEDISEFDKFFNNFDGNVLHEQGFNIIMAALDNIGNDGPLDTYLRREGGRLKAVPIEACTLRLYMFQVNDEIILLGNGGIKKTRTYQLQPELNKYVSNLREVGRKLLNRSNYSTRGNIYGKELYGDLEFEIETS